jgi:DNA-binding transcriptional regulator YdaS (Cro superfamily)
MIMKTAENRVGNDSKILSQLGQKPTAISQIIRSSCDG